MKKEIIEKKINFINDNCDKFYLLSEDDRIVLLEYIFSEETIIDESFEQYFNTLYGILDKSTKNIVKYSNSELNTGALLRSWRDSVEKSKRMDELKRINKIAQIYNEFYQTKLYVNLNINKLLILWNNKYFYYLFFLV